MIYGMKVAAQSMDIELTRQQVITNNLANINTTAFKRQDIFTEVLEKKLKSKDEERPFLETNKVLLSSYIDFKRGSLKQTDNPLDLALATDGFFVINTPKGLRFTRRGDFSLNEYGEIVDFNGNQLMGRKGPINIVGKKFHITEDGEVYVDGKYVDQILVVDFSDRENTLISHENGYFEAKDLSTQIWTKDVKIMQGFLETSNVNPINEMVKLIDLYRTFEINQKVITTIDTTLDKAVNQVGRV